MKNVICWVLTSLLLLSGIIVIAESASAQRSGTDQATLLLDLKRAQAAYEIAKQQFENDEKLFEENAISKKDYNDSRSRMLSALVEYQKLILRVISQQSYIVVERAIKYQTADRKRKVKIILRSTASGNEEFLQFFQQNDEIFTPEMRPEKVYNIFVSLVNLSDQTIIGDPYEAHVPSIKFGESVEVHFTLLRDVESLQVLLNYGDRSEQRNVYLQQDASANIVDISSMQFSQEADLGGTATYELTLERFSGRDENYKLDIINLPRQISFDFIDRETNARLSQVSFPQGVTNRRLSLRTNIPTHDDEQVVIDKPLVFYAVVITRENADKLGNLRGRTLTTQEIERIEGGKVRLELIPRGVGRIEVRAPSLYHEITVGDSISMEITIHNDGTRRLDNIKVSTDNPLHWRSVIVPDLIRSLEPDKDATVNITIIPSRDEGVGAQEVKIKTEALADNRRVQTEDKTVRIQIEAKTPLLGSILLILFLIGLVVGVVIFGIKLSRR